MKNIFKKYFSCEYRWHKWIPVFIKSKYNLIIFKFIACYCDRCFKWQDEVTIINDLAINRHYWTYCEEYFNK